MSKNKSNKNKKIKISHFFKKVRKIFIYGISAFFILSILSVFLLRFIPVYFTPLMVLRSAQSIIKYEEPKNNKKWVKLENITPNMTMAVIASEDNLFIKHNGFSQTAIRKAIEDKKNGKKIRGGSSISQQTAKNVFTFGSRTWFRKGLEAYYTVLIEIFWSKKRIMEVYLNIVELGNGVYGVEAAANEHFKTTSSKLSKSQCALLAAALPSPRKYNVTKPGPYMQRRQNQILSLMPKMGKIDFLKIKGNSKN